MKNLFLFIIVLFFIQNIELFGKKYDKDISNLFEKYLLAFKNADFELIKSISTANYINKQGGEARFKEVINSLKQDYQGSKIEGLKIVSKDKDNKTLYVRFKIAKGKKALDEMLNQWFYVISLKPGAWQIDDLLNDFDPNEKEK